MLTALAAISAALTLALAVVEAGRARRSPNLRWASALACLASVALCALYVTTLLTGHMPGPQYVRPAVMLLVGANLARGVYEYYCC